MSHEFESGFFVHKPAWHRLGKVLNNPPTIEQAIINAGLNWKVLEKPIFHFENDVAYQIKTHKSLVRDKDQKVLGIVSKYYHPLQNSEAFSWFDFLLHEGEVSLEAAGSLKEGKRIWVLARINLNSFEVNDGDAILPYLLLHNSHDGSTAIWLQFTPIRVVCWNTLSWATASRYQDKQRGKAIRIRHNSNIQLQLSIAKQALNLAQRTFNDTAIEYKAMAQTSISQIMFNNYLTNIFETDKPQEMKCYYQILENFESGLGNHGRTVWDAYNGFTQYLDYQKGRSETSRLESTWFGNSARLRMKAHQEALALI